MAMAKKIERRIKLCTRRVKNNGNVSQKKNHQLVENCAK